MDPLAGEEYDLAHRLRPTSNPVPQHYAPEGLEKSLERTEPAVGWSAVGLPAELAFVAGPTAVAAAVGIVAAAETAAAVEIAAVVGTAESVELVAVAEEVSAPVAPPDA